MHLHLLRYHQDHDATLGILHLQGAGKPIYTLEPPWRDNQRNRSCIPAGTYEGVPFSGRRYRNVYELQNVEGRDAILIHAGNDAHDTRGCLLPGLGINFSGQPMLTHSMLALNLIRSILSHEHFTITIRHYLALPPHRHDS